MSTPASMIPAHPGVPTPVGAAPPPPVASLNTQIPVHPAIAAQMAAARGKAPTASQGLGEDFAGDGGDANPQADWFAAAAMGQPTPTVPSAPPGSQDAPVQVSSQPGENSFGDIDALLRDLPTGEPPTVVPQAQPVQVQSPQQMQPPPVQQMQVPQQPVPPAPVQAPVAPMSPEQAQSQLIDTLMARDYRLSDVQERALIAEPGTVLPRLAAQTHVNVLRDVGQQLAVALPQIVNALVQRQLSGQRNEMEFYRRYPQLNKPEFRTTVETALQQVKGTQPDIDQNTLFEQGATLAAIRLRQQFGRQRPAAAPQQHMRAPMAPFVPQAPGTPAVPNAPGNENWWSQVSREADLFDTWN